MMMSRVERGEVDIDDLIDEVKDRIEENKPVRKKVRRPTISNVEKRKRQKLCRRAVTIHGSNSAACREIGVSMAQFHYWITGSRPVPDKWVDKLKEVNQC
jgi:hypothetical protein